MYNLELLSSIVANKEKKKPKLKLKDLFDKNTILSKSKSKSKTKKKKNLDNQQGHVPSNFHKNS